MTTPIRIHTAATIMSTKLTALLHLVDPTLPIGGFNHSGGLETFVQQRIVNSRADLQEYVAVQLRQNWAHNDGAYVSLAYDAAAHGDLAALLKLDAKISANKAPREIREAAAKLGVRLLKIFARYENAPVLQDFQTAVTAKEAYGFYPLVFGLIAALGAHPKDETLTAFYYNAAVGAVTNGVKLIPLSQMDGQDILFELRLPIANAVADSLVPDENRLGAASIASDIRAMQHERLYTRLYMS
ncbi:urease accessory protein UreF [Neisseria chenwenguii]|nr:urease accessory protein UreF [Neisseria chenwenguii]